LIVSNGGLTGAATGLGGVGIGLTCLGTGTGFGTGGFGTGLGVGFGTGFGTGGGALTGTGVGAGGALFATGGKLPVRAAVGTASAAAPGVATPVITGTEVVGGVVAGPDFVAGGVTPTRVTLIETSCVRRSNFLNRFDGIPRPGKSNLMAKISACSTSDISSARFKSRRKRQRRQARPRFRFLERTGCSDLTVDGVQKT
jgi:hypothetical protein